MKSSFHKLYSLFTPQERRRLVLLLFAVILMAVFEVGGVASILPFMTLVNDPAGIEAHRIYGWFYTNLGFKTHQGFMMAVGLFCLGALVVSNVFSALTQAILLRFSYMRSYALARRILINYIRKPYLFSVERNSAELGKNILHEVILVVHFVIVPGLQMIAKGFVAVALIVLLFLVDPVLALIISLILGGSYIGIYSLLQRKLAQLGKLRVKSDSERFKAATQAFGAIKDIKLLGREDAFIDEFSKAALTSARCDSIEHTASLLPRYALEILIFGGAIIVALYFFYVRSGAANALPVIALFTLAGFRLMPALQQTFQSLTYVRYYFGSVDVLYNDVREGCKSDKHLMIDEKMRKVSFQHSIDLRNVSFAYPGAVRPSINDVSLSIMKNSTVGFIGKTGSGKTTLIDILLGLIAPDKGVLLVDGVEIDSNYMRSWQDMIGYVPQHIYLSDDTITKNIAFGIPENDIDSAAVERAAAIANIHDIICDLDLGYNTVIGERGIRLSGGERQRIGIARALYHDPALLVMDEATSSLDNETEEAVMTAINNLSHQKTILLIAHRLTTLRECDAIYKIENGQANYCQDIAFLLRTSIDQQGAAFAQ